MRRAHAFRTAAALTFAIVGALATSPLAAQQGPPFAGRNVNVIGGPTWVKTNPFEIVGDPWRNQTVEPECDVSSRNPAVIVCGGVDYRMVDLPGGFLSTSVPPSPHPDSWNMVAQSRDGALTFVSRPHPGHLLDESGTATALKKYEFSADPTVRFGAAGVMFYLGLAANRGDNALATIYVSVWMHLNNLEYDPEPVKFTGRLTELVKGSSGLFPDRPYLAIGEPTGHTCTIDVPVYDAESNTTTTVTQTVPCTPAYVGYATFVGDRKNGPRSKIYFTKSYNLGKGWTQPVLVSEQNAINQGVQIVRIPGTRRIIVFWRRGGAMDAQTDAIMYAVSENDGDSFAKAKVFAPICQFDQGNDATHFRVRTMPNGAPGPGRAYVVWAARGVTPGGACDPTAQSARVFIATTDGAIVSGPMLVDPGSPVKNHELFPTVAIAAGKVHVAWMDFRNDESLKYLPSDWFNVREINEADNFPPDASAERARHTADMWAAEADVAPSLSFGPAFQVSQYIFGKPKNETGRRQLQWNVPLARNFNKMTIPFHGDFNASRGELVVPVDPVVHPGEWGFNFGAGGTPPRTPVFHDFWTDGRNMVLLSNEDYGSPIGSIPRPYTPPSLDQADGSTIGSTSLYDPGQGARPACDASYPGTKNLDIYTSRTTQGLYAFAPWNNKSLGHQTYTDQLQNGFLLPEGQQDQLVQRAFPVVVENTSDIARTFTLLIENQPPGDASFPGFASFDQFMALPSVSVTVSARSMAARTVYVKSTDKAAPIKISTTESGGGPATTVFLNPDRTAPDNLLQPGQVDPVFNISRYEVHDVVIDSVIAQDINLQTVPGQGLTEGQSDDAWPDPGWKNPGWKNPGWKNDPWQYPGWKNTSFEQPGWKNSDFEQPGWKNEALSDDPTGSSSRYVTARVVSTGCRTGDAACENTYTAYNANVLVSGADPTLQYQLIVYTLYTAPATTDCLPYLVGHTQVLVNIPNYNATGTTAGNAVAAVNPDASFVLGPDETAYIVLVAFAAGVPVFTDEMLPVQNVGFSVTPQPFNTDDYLYYDVVCPSCERPPNPPPAPQPLITITTSTLPDGAIGVPYTAPGLTASGGSDGYTWTVTSGALPPGLDLSIAGVISGTPTSTGTFGFTVRATDSANPALSNTRTFTIAITPAPGDIIVADGVYGSAGRLLRVAPDGSGASVFAQFPAGSRAFDVAQDANGDFFVAVPAPAPSIVKVSRTGLVSTLYAGSPAATPPLSNPVAIAVDSAGAIYVGDNDTDRVYRFTPNGTSWNIQVLALTGPSSTLRQGLDLAVEGPGVVIVAYEAYNNGTSYSSAIERMDFGTSTVTPILWPGKVTFDGTPPSRIDGLAIDSFGWFVVTDFDDSTLTPYPHAVYRISPDGNSGGVIADSLGSAPADVAIEPSGTYVVSISGGGQIVRVDPGNGIETVILTGPPLSWPNGVTIVQPLPIAGPGGS